MEIPPLPFRSLTLSLLLLSTLLHGLCTWGVPNSTTNQQHGIPCFTNEGLSLTGQSGPVSALWSGAPQRNAKEGERKKEEEKEAEGERSKFRTRGDLVDGEAGPECSQTHGHSGI